MATKKEKIEARDNAREWLRARLAPGDTVYTVVSHEARSGASRSIRVFIMLDGDPFDASGFVARAIEERFDDKNGGVRVGGGGMDMGVHLVYTLGHALWPAGYMCVGNRCRANDHVNTRSPRDGLMMHSDPGYALNQRWL